MNQADMEKSFKSALFKDDDLGSVIRVHLHIEHHVNEILELLVPCPKDLKSVRLDYDGKVNLLPVLGVKPESIKVLSALGTMRNKFAHNLNFKLDKSNVKNLYETLDVDAKDILFSSHEMTRTKEQHKDIKPYKKLTPKDQFILIAVVVKNMLQRIKSELNSTV
jgi:hypothetical protein